MLSTLAATTRFLSSGNRLPMLRRALDHWRYLNSDLVPQRFLVEIFPETAGRVFPVSTDVRHHFELPYGERMVLGAIVNTLQPRIVFEFGTYTGATTTLIADACPPGSVINTLDLPPEELKGTAVSEDDIGSRFKDNPRYEGRIVQHRVNSRSFDCSPFEKRVDLVYVDASHKFEDVIHDSQLGMRMLAPNGVMVWDDYQASTIPVAAALDEVAKGASLERVFNTRLVVHRSGR